MPSSLAVVRSFALALFGFGAASAFGQNVTAFNPFSGVGLSGGPTPTYGAQAAYPVVDTVGPGTGPAGGPAFNPWQSSGSAPAAAPAATAFNPGVGAFNPTGGAFVPPAGGAFNPAEAPLAPSAPAYVGNARSHLPAPPPGPIESRLVAIPERGTARIPRDLLYSGAAPATPPLMTAEPAPLPASVAVRSEPSSTPTPVATPTPVTRPVPPPPAPAPIVTAPVVPPPAPASRPAPPPPVAAAPAAPPVPAPVASAAPPPRGVPVTTQSTDPASKGSTVASIPFAGQSAELSEVAKSELDRVAKNISEKSLRQVELRAFASGVEPDSRKIALARALVVRSYLIDRGVKSRIEVGGFAGDGERVEILAPNT